MSNAASDEDVVRAALHDAQQWRMSLADCWLRGTKENIEALTLASAYEIIRAHPRKRPTGEPRNTLILRSLRDAIRHRRGLAEGLSASNPIRMESEARIASYRALLRKRYRDDVLPEDREDAAAAPPAAE